MSLHRCTICNVAILENEEGDLNGSRCEDDYGNAEWFCNPCQDTDAEEARQDLLLHPYVPPYVPERY